MDYRALGEEIAAKAKAAIEGLHAFGYPVGSLPFPGLVVGLPSQVDYRRTYGQHQAPTIPIWVMVSKSDTRSGALRLLDYLSVDGPMSIVKALNSGPDNEYENCDELTIMTGEPGTYTYNGIDAFGIEFTAEIAGS